MVYGKRMPINGDVAMLRLVDDLAQTEKDLLDVYQKVTSHLPGGQTIRRKVYPVCVGFRVMFGDVFFFTATPDRRHSKLAFRLMRRFFGCILEWS